VFDKIKPAVALFAITFFFAFALGFVHDITLSPIEAQKAKNEAETVSSLVPGVEETASFTVDDGTEVKKIIECYGGSEIVGHAVVVEPKGYGGPIELMVAFGTDGSINGAMVLSHTETPGLGSLAALPAFTDLFVNKTGRFAVVKSNANADANEIQAITSATITTEAVVRGVNAAVEYFEVNIWRR